MHCKLASGCERNIKAKENNVFMPNCPRAVFPYMHMGKSKEKKVGKCRKLLYFFGESGNSGGFSFFSFFVGGKIGKLSAMAAREENFLLFPNLFLSMILAIALVASRKVVFFFSPFYG